MDNKIDNRGFSLIELIVTIAIFSVLTSVLAVSVLAQLEKAKRVEALTSAENICTAIQAAIVDMSATDVGAFGASLKHTKDGQPIGSFTSTTMYKYMSMGEPSTMYSTLADDSRLECYLSAIASNTIGGSENYGITGGMTTGSLSGKSSKVLSDTSQYGQMVFSMAYNMKCEILYFECVYKGFYVKIQGTEYVTERVSDDLKFESWP